MVKANLRRRLTRRKKVGWRGQIFIIFGVMMAIVFLPTTLLLLIGMLPTPMSGLIDRGRYKSRMVTVGAMNLAGCSPFLMDLWVKGNDFTASIDIIINPQTIIIIYFAAAFGYMIDWAMTGFVATMLYQRGGARQRAIKERQKDLVKRWGEEVTGKIMVDEYGFPLESAEERNAKIEGEDQEVKNKKSEESEDEASR